MAVLLNHLKSTILLIFSSFALFLLIILSNPGKNRNDLKKSIKSIADKNGTFQITKNFVFPKKEKVLLLGWTKFWGRSWPEIWNIKECDLKHRCSVTADWNQLENANAVLFHEGEIDLENLPDPKKRKPNKVFVYFRHESPKESQKGFQVPSGFFNWTMTHRTDSDVFYPYFGKVRHSETPIFSEKELFDKYMPEIRKKSKMIAWFVSNCKSISKRELFAEKINSTGAKVDIFGNCGQNVCPKSISGPYLQPAGCTKRILKSYKFYLAFENNLCRDYITEKYWFWWLEPLIPIVLKRENYKNVAPPNSLIAVDDFRNIEQLVAHLKYLDQNDTAYFEYFKWRAFNYSIAEQGPGNRVGFCLFCEKLLNGEHLEKSKFYENLKKWWWEEADCDSEGKFAEKYLYRRF